MKYLLGIDFGTGGSKATVLDSDGNMLTSAFKEYPSIHIKPGWSEQDPTIWIEALKSVLKDCEKSLGSLDGISSIAITGSTHNAVLLDKNDEVIRNAIMWNDQRSDSQCEYLMKEYGDQIFDLAMAMPTPTWTLPQLLWVKDNEPENYKKIKRILFVKDYIRSYLTNDNYTDIVDAQGSLLYDLNKKEWSEDLCNMIGLSVESLPEVKLPKDIAGYVSKEISLELGLKEGTPIIVGSTDTAVEDFGAGAVEKGQLIVKMATAGNVNIILDEAKPHSKTYTYPYVVDNMYYSVTGTNTSAASYRWLRDALYCSEKDICDKEGTDVYILMNEEADRVDVGSDGLIFHPYLLGERCPHFNSNMRSNFFGVSMIHERGHFSRAVLEGVAYSLYDCFNEIKSFNEEFKDIRIIGGGAKSPLWCQIVSDVFGLEVKQPRVAESSYGGALLAGIAIGIFEDEIDATNKCVEIKKVFKPNMENHRKYQEYFKIYQEISKTMVPIWDKLANI